MLRAAFLLAVTLALALAGCGGEDGEARPPAKQQEQQQPTTLLGTISKLDGSGNLLAHLDPATLRPAGQQLEIGEYHDTWSLSPDGRRVALGISAPAPDGSGRVGIIIFDTGTLEVTQQVEAGIVAEGVAWLAPRRVVAQLQSGEFIVVDPDTGKVLKRTRASARCIARSAQTPRHLVALLTHPARLAAVDAQGRVRVARLRGLSAPGCSGLAVTVDDRGTRAFAAARGGELAEVDLATMRSTLHRDAVRPRAGYRTLDWVAGRRVAAASRTIRDAPLGVQLVDLARDRRRTLAARAGGVAVTPGGILVFDGGYSLPRRDRGIGLRLHDRTGALRRHTLRGKRVWDVEVAGDRLYAFSTRVRVLDLRSGRTLSSAPRIRDEVDLLLP